MPIRMPVRKTSRPPITTWNTAAVIGVSMNRWRTQEITPSSTRTTAPATAVAVWTWGMRYGSGKGTGHLLASMLLILRSRSLPDKAPVAAPVAGQKRQDPDRALRGPAGIVAVGAREMCIPYQFILWV